MADRPMLFSPPMVRALLDGRKTQTRRIAKFVEPQSDGFWHCKGNCGGMMGMDEQQVREWGAGYAPYAFGDRLWVKETHAYVGSCDPGYLLFKASDFTEQCDRYGFDKPYPPISDVKWTPSIFMRRKASRLTLTVTNVRVERLQACSHAEAMAEGINCYPFYPSDDHPLCDGYTHIYPDDKESVLHPTSKEAYAALWNSINGAGAWEQNPWVVALTFDVDQKNIDY